jgi:hypothetical protein
LPAHTILLESRQTNFKAPLSDFHHVGGYLFPFALHNAVLV